jgi:transposase
MTTVDLVPDRLWNAIQPLLPPEPPKPKGGRPRVSDLAVLGGIVFMLRAGLPWRLLPARELGAGSPVTCWRRQGDAQAMGDQLQQAESGDSGGDGQRRMLGDRGAAWASTRQAASRWRRRRASGWLRGCGCG